MGLSHPRELETGKSELDHIEITNQTNSEISSINHENIAYGKGGVAGIISSPFIFGVACLASMGGFSFGELNELSQHFNS